MERTTTTGRILAVEPAQRRTFSLRQANRSLVLVRRIAADIAAEYARLLEHQEMLELAQRRAAPQELERIQGVMAGCVARLRGYIDELDAVGARLADVTTGGVDFPAVVAGRSICFCWQCGEPRVSHWHDRDDESHMRRPIAELILAPTS